MKEEIVFTASDLKSLIYSKGTVYSGFTTLLNEAGTDFSMVERIPGGNKDAVDRLDDLDQPATRKKKGSTQNG